MRSYFYNRDYVEISELVGKTLKNCYRTDQEIHFITEKDEHYVMYHEQSCCESVYIEDMEGELDYLVGTEILVAEEVSNDLGAMSEYDESFTWTFYKLATIKGYVDIRWYGSSNGYYSERVDFIKLTEDE